MSSQQLRKIMIGVFFGSIILMVVASYLLMDTPREGGIINSGFEEAVTWKTEHYPSGAVRAEGHMKGYLKEGAWVYYKESGDTLLVEVYNSGKIVSTKQY